MHCTLALFKLKLSALAFTVLTAALPGMAQTEAILHTFNNNGRDGAVPYAGLVRDSAGNLYGTTGNGGSGTVCGGNCGTVFELSPRTTGGWSEKIIHSFNNNGRDGFESYSGLLLDAAGNLYGETTGGGINGDGIVFELTPQAVGWRESILHSFSIDGIDGFNPYGALISDSAGNLYGTTSAGGAYSQGAVYELSPQAGGSWSEQIIYSFINNGTDGEAPFAGLVFDSAGNLYGTTAYGGPNSNCLAFNCGAVFELSPHAGSAWTETIVHNFTGDGVDGYYPFANLIVDASGNLYGTTVNGGRSGGGTVFEISPEAGGGWSERVLANFGGVGHPGFPEAGVIMDAAGNLFGTTQNGGTPGPGTVFEVSPLSGGSAWGTRILHSFGSGTDGTEPWGGLVFDPAGNLYGTTAGGGAYSDGIVFEIKR